MEIQGGSNQSRSYLNHLVFLTKVRKSNERRIEGLIQFNIIFPSRHATNIVCFYAVLKRITHFLYCTPIRAL